MYFPLQQARVKQQVNIIDPSMGALMVAVKTELECYLVHRYVSLYTFILYNYGNSSFTSFRSRITAKEIVK
jgi:hypothetical protein